MDLCAGLPTALTNECQALGRPLSASIVMWWRPGALSASMRAKSASASSAILRRTVTTRGSLVKAASRRHWSIRLLMFLIIWWSIRRKIDRAESGSRLLLINRGCCSAATQKVGAVGEAGCHAWYGNIARLRPLKRPSMLSTGTLRALRRDASLRWNSPTAADAFVPKSYAESSPAVPAGFAP